MKNFIINYEKNQLNSIISDLTKPQKTAIREIFRGLFHAQEPILRRISQNLKISAKSAGKKFGKHWKMSKF